MPEVRERAVGMVREHHSEYDSEWEAMRSIAQEDAVSYRLLPSRSADGARRGTSTPTPLSARRQHHERRRHQHVREERDDRRGAGEKPEVDHSVVVAEKEDVEAHREHE